MIALAGVEVTTDPVLHAIIGLLGGAWDAEPVVLAGNGHWVALPAHDVPRLIAITRSHVVNCLPTRAVVR